MEQHEIKEELLDIANGNVTKAQPAEGVNMYEWVFANERNPALLQLFHSLYEGAFKNRLGIAHCKNRTNDKLQTLIVGVNPTEGGGAQLYPLAVILEEDQLADFMSPDGHGGYVGVAE